MSQPFLVSLSFKLKRLFHYALKLRVLPAYVFQRYIDPVLVKKPSSNNTKKRNVIYIVENANWSIKADGQEICKRVRALGRKAFIDSSSLLYAGNILHFGSGYSFSQEAFRKTSRNNKVIVTFFHGKYGDHPLLDQLLDKLKNNISNIDAIAVANSTMQSRFLDMGVPKEKLYFIPLGVDLNFFKPLSEQERLNRRTQKNIPEDAFVVGSFQKDGDGWGEGLNPKMIKGPDVFCDAMKTLKEKHKKNVFCLLSGPARGYVKKRLEEDGIPYLHYYFDDPNEVAQLYQLLDAYAVSSREEGGPKAILESLACGVPLVTTDVGMAKDVLEGQECGFICPVEDSSAIANALNQIAQDPCLREQLKVKGLQRVQKYSWEQTAQECETMYQAVEKL